MRLNISYAVVLLGGSIHVDAFVTRSGVSSYPRHFAASQNDSTEVTTKPESDVGESMKDGVKGSVAAMDLPDDVTEDAEMRRLKLKADLFGLIGSKPVNQNAGYEDPVLADPKTKESLKIRTIGPLIGGESRGQSIKVLLKSSENTYQGRSDTYYDLLGESSLESATMRSESKDEKEDNPSSTTVTDLVNSFRVFIPPPVRNVLATTGVLPGDDYIPMRDLFTSPQVSFAYERGWRQGFAAAGFPGADKEYELVKEYFQPLEPDTVVVSSDIVQK